MTYYGLVKQLIAEGVMLVDKQFKHLFKDLLNHQDVEIMLNGTPITLQTLENKSKLHVKTPVYFGGNYIPKSVRNCLHEQAPFDSQRIRTYLSVDEDQFQISLNYLGTMREIHPENLFSLLHEFSWLAEEWKNYLDQHDKNDLVHVRVK